MGSGIDILITSDGRAMERGKGLRLDDEDLSGERDPLAG